MSPPKGSDLRNTDFNIPRFNSVYYGKHSVRYFGPYLWGELNHDDRNITSINEENI